MKKEREENICPDCGKLLKPIYENNGFNEPDPTMLEVTGWEVCECGYNPDDSDQEPVKRE